LTDKFTERIREQNREKRIAMSREQNIKWCAKMNSRRVYRGDEGDDDSD